MQKKDYSNLFRLTPKDKDKEEAGGPAEWAGALLKKERLALGLTLEDVAADTNISVRCLHALEENDQAGMPARAFVRGFISIYARHLRLDPQALLARHQQQTGSGQGSEIDAQAIIKLHPVVKDRPFFSPRLLAALASAAALLGLLYWGYTYYF